MRKMDLVLLCAVALAGGACYHATVETGATPATQTVEKGWASGWIYGLVPPSTVETASRCPNGVARVETQVSFGNQLVAFLTLGIYTPMSIKVTCATARPGPDEAEEVLQVGPGLETAADALNEAASRVRGLGRPVLVRF
jgi:hypothetical protein